MPTPYDTDLDRNAANFQPLTPLSFLARAAGVLPTPPRSSTASCAAPIPRLLRPRPPARLGARQAAAIGRGDTVSVMLANTPAMIEAHYGVPMTGAVLNTLNTRLDARDPRLHARPRRNQGADHRPRIFQGDQGGAVARQSEAAGHRLRRSRIHRRRRAPRQHRIRGTSREGDRGLRLDDAGRRVGRDLASTTPPARPAIPRASSITTAAPICSRSATCSPAAWASIPSISGRCRCSTATAGAFRGRSRSSPAPMSACARCARRRSSTRSPRHKVTHLCGAPIVMSTLLNASTPRRSRCRTWSSSSPRRRRRPRRCWQAMRAAGFNVTHVYGLTETYGPALDQRLARRMGRICLPRSRRPRRRARACAIRCSRRSTCSTPTRCSRCRATARRSAR